MTTYYGIDYEDISENVLQYDSLDELLQETTQFYHDTFANEEDYDENREYTNLQDALELWEGNGYVIAEELSTGVETSSCKFEIFTEKGTVVEVDNVLYKLLAIQDDYQDISHKHYSSFNIQYLLENIENSDFLVEEKKILQDNKTLLQDCKMLLDEHKVDFIQFEEL